MTKNKKHSFYSGASPAEVRSDLKHLINFTAEGSSLEEIQLLCEQHLAPHLLQYNHTGFQSMFNAQPEDGARLGANIALDYNQGVTNWQVSPGGAVLELMCCEALCRLFELRGSAGSTMMYSGTYANQQAIYMAVHQLAEDEGFDFTQKGLLGFQNPERIKIIVAEDVHFSVRHAIRMIGLGENNLVQISQDNRLRMSSDALQKRTLTLLKDGQKIACIIATVGSTSTGAVDNIEEISAISSDHNITLHVDGAYGLIYSILKNYKSLFSGLEKADYLSWDPHKQMGVPIPNSVLFANDKNELNRMALYSAYFNRKEEMEPNPGMWSIPSTRPMSSLPLVTSIIHQGLRQLKNRLAAPLNAISALYEYLSEQPDFELFHQPDLGILCFRILYAELNEDQLEELQQEVFRAIMRQGNRSISVTRIKGKMVIRIMAINPEIKLDHLKETIKDISFQSKQLLK